MPTPDSAPAPAPAAAGTRCAHCGLVVPAGLVDPGAARQFCCQGCRAVHAVIHEHGLERYYALRGSAEPPGAPASPTGSSYAELDDPGFHHSVLGDFRERLLEEGRADRLLDLALARLKEAGLVRERTTQRTDSTHVLAAVRSLTRLELVTEAVRAALEELARTADHALEGLVDDNWGRRYGRPVRLGKNPT